jgi:hypothetical protein
MEQRQYQGDANNKTYTHKTPSFVDHQILTAESDTFLQMSIHKLGNVTSNYGQIIAINNIKTDPSETRL